jgi:hypothetical protein
MRYIIRLISWPIWPIAVLIVIIVMIIVAVVMTIIMVVVMVRTVYINWPIAPAVVWAVSITIG